MISFFEKLHDVCMITLAGFATLLLLAIIATPVALLVLN